MKLLTQNTNQNKFSQSDFNIERGCRCMHTKKLTNSGFTLIELLIVIVIIGILAGVVIGVLNPVQQQNRAKDATFRSALSKMSLSAKALFVSSPRTANRSPTYAEFYQGVGGALPATVGTLCDDGVAGTADDLAGTSGSCNFLVDGLSLPTDCAISGFNGASSGNACHFVYYRSGDRFNIGVRSASRPERFFVYSYTESTGGIQEGFFSCPVDTGIDQLTSYYANPANCDQTT